MNIVITGASSGVGEAAALKFSQEGHPLLLLARRLDRMEALDLPDTLCRKLDVTDLQSFQTALEEAEDQSSLLYMRSAKVFVKRWLMIMSGLSPLRPASWKRKFLITPPVLKPCRTTGTIKKRLEEVSVQQIPLRQSGIPIANHKMYVFVK